MIREGFHQAFCRCQRPRKVSLRRASRKGGGLDRATGFPTPRSALVPDCCTWSEATLDPFEFVLEMCCDQFFRKVRRTRTAQFRHARWGGGFVPVAQSNQERPTDRISKLGGQASLSPVQGDNLPDDSGSSSAAVRRYGLGPICGGFLLCRHPLESLAGAAGLSISVT